MKKAGKNIFFSPLRNKRKSNARGKFFARIRARLRGMKEPGKASQLLIQGELCKAGFDPELLFVECASCGAPVLWEPGKATKLLRQAGVDPCELDSSCMLVTDGCPSCSQRDEYTVRIFRVSDGSPAAQPPRVGHA